MRTHHSPARIRRENAGTGPGGEGGSWLWGVFTVPRYLSESVPPIGLLAISLALSAFLVVVATVSLSS